MATVTMPVPSQVENTIPIEKQGKEISKEEDQFTEEEEEPAKADDQISLPENEPAKTDDQLPLPEDEPTKVEDQNVKKDNEAGTETEDETGGFDHMSRKMMCPNCRKMIDTQITKEANSFQWFLCVCLGCIGLCLCCWIPFCLDSMWAVTHSCPQCKKTLGFYKGGMN